MRLCDAKSQPPAGGPVKITCSVLVYGLMVPVVYISYGFSVLVFYVFTADITLLCKKKKKGIFSGSIVG